MVLPSLLQAAAQTPPAETPLSPNALLVVATAGLLTSVGQWIAAHVKGRKADRSKGSQLSAIAEGITEIKNDVRDLKALVIGVDGKNGLRSEVAANSEDIDELKRRGFFATPPDRPRLDPRDVGIPDRRSAV